MFPQAFAAIAAATAVLSVGEPSMAQPAGPELAIRVNVMDLNLQSEAGAHVALQRVQNAARVICGAEREQRDLSRAIKYAACVRETVDDAVASVQIAKLTELNGQAIRPPTVIASRR
jgi:UrcA family protein